MSTSSFTFAVSALQLPLQLPITEPSQILRIIEHFTPAYMHLHCDVEQFPLHSNVIKSIISFGAASKVVRIGCRIFPFFPIPTLQETFHCQAIFVPDNTFDTSVALQRQL